jgi:hypothetical protein
MALLVWHDGMYGMYHVRSGWHKYRNAWRGSAVCLEIECDYLLISTSSWNLFEVISESEC